MYAYTDFDRQFVHARAAQFRDQLERVKPVPQAPEWERIATELRLVLEKVVREPAVLLAKVKPTPASNDGRKTPPPSNVRTVIPAVKT